MSQKQWSDKKREAMLRAAQRTRENNYQRLVDRARALAEDAPPWGDDLRREVRALLFAPSVRTLRGIAVGRVSRASEATSARSLTPTTEHRAC